MKSDSLLPKEYNESSDLGPSLKSVSNEGEYSANMNSFGITP